MNINTGTSVKTYFPNLDGLRFWAFLAVFLGHARGEFIFPFEPGKLWSSIVFRLTSLAGVGVGFFFVLSGFLIVFLLINEKVNFGRIGLGNFYMRRILRIWPLYFLILFIGLILPHFFSILNIRTSGDNIAFFVTFFANFQYTSQHWGDGHSFILGVLWSISVEEQFYIIIPLLLAGLHRKWISHLFVGIIIASFIFRCTHNTPNMRYYHTLGAISDLALGGLTAFLIIEKTDIVTLFNHLNRKWIYLFYLFFFFLISTKTNTFNFSSETWWMPFEKPLFSICFSFIILEQNFAKESFFKCHKSKIVTYLGRISFGLYMYHGLVLICVKSLLYPHVEIFRWGFLAAYPIALFLNIGLAHLSFQYLEMPILKLKEYFI